MKVAIIGSGIAGNTLVWQLQKAHDVTVFEAGSYLGGHTHTHDINLEGQSLRVDSGFIVFNERTYPNFIAMLDKLGVEKQPTSMSFSVHCEKTGLEYAGTNLNALFSQRRNLFNRDFHRLLQDILRFNREAPELLGREDSGLTLGDYLRDGGYSRQFCDYYILPMGAAIWSQDLEQMLYFPARFFIRFFSNHGLLSIKNRPQWYVVKGGSRTYVDRIYDNFTGQIHLNTPVTAVRRFEDRVEITSQGGCEIFDAVFFACHSDQALAMLQDATPQERETLAALPYQRNTAVMHLGENLLPQRKRAWSSWNYRIPQGAQGDSHAATVTYHMNQLQSLPIDTTICVTLNNRAQIADRDILAELEYDHPVFTEAGIRAQQNQSLLNGQWRSFYCGAYWRYGFHEDGVVSALTALQDFNQWCARHEEQPLPRAS